MSSSELDLQLATSWMTTISLFIIIFMGSFGCLCNIVIFTSKKLKKNSCAFYFLCTALVELCILCFGVISRLADENFGSTLLSQSRIYCKIRSYLLIAMGTIATDFVLLTAIDRCMATSVHARYRAFSEIKIARRVALATIIIVMVVSIHALIFYDPQPLCIPQPGVYALFFSIYLIVWDSTLPDGLILIFTLWTLKNAKQTRSRIATDRTTNTPKQRRMQRTEAQLVIMMFSQALISIFIDITRYSCYAYYFLTTNIPQSSYQQTVVTFIFQLSNVLSYINYSKSFYIYTLSSRLFRTIFCEMIQHCFHKLRPVLKKSHVHPIVVVQFSNNGMANQHELQPI